MSRLDELIAELCPNGVEYKSIGEISTDIYRGSSITRDQVTKEGTPCVRYGEIYTTYGVWFDQCVSHTNVSKISNAKYFEHGDILFAITGESVEDIAKSCAYVGYEKCLAGGDIVVLKHKEDPKYLAYALTTTNARNQKSKGKVKSKVVHSSVPAIKEIIVPVPPLEVQREIVRVLDNFTFLSAKLSAELSAELSARRKQYEYYRNQLLSFGSSTSQRRLEEICSIITDGSHWSPQEASEGFYMASVKDMRPNGFNYSSCKKIKKEDFDSLLKNGCRPEKGDVLVAKDGATMLKHAFVADGKEDLVVLSSIAILRPKQELINPSYLAHYFRQESFKERVIRTYSTVGGVPRIILKGFKKMEITVPPLEVQNRLVSVLDNFEAICSNLNIGLPAEIEARQKQYEYYRDLLLTFAETGNTLVTDGRTARQAEIALLQYVFGYVVLPLGDTCNMKAGKAIQAVELAEERDSDHPYLCYGGNGIRGYIGKTNYSGDYPIVGRQGALCGNVQYAEGDFYATEHAVVVTSKGLYKQRYLYYLLTAMNLNQYKSAGAQPGLAVGRIETISAPVPTLEKQEEIVRILDKFDRLCNDLSSGLPAEIVARQKQYVYYRDKLLTFQQIS